jgi:hypothetical protein
MSTTPSTPSGSHVDTPLLHDDNELPEDHAGLVRLAQDFSGPAAPVLVSEPDLPPQRTLQMRDEITECADALGDEPLVGLITHGR